MKPLQKFLSALLCVALMLCMLPVMAIPASAEVTPSSLGLTEQDGKYLISSVEDWIKLGTVTSFDGESFLQTADLDFSDHIASADNNRLMLGSQKSYPFAATYDGGGYVIRGLNISHAGYVGLFAYIKGATIQNVTVTDCTFTTTQSNGYIGGIVGSAVGQRGETDKNTVKNCTVTESVALWGMAGSVRMGGIVGDAAHSNPNYNQVIEISDCNVAASMHVPTASGVTQQFIGGIVGISSFNTSTTSTRLNSITIKNCISTVTLDAVIDGTLFACIGGIAGELNPTSSTVEGCYAAPVFNLTRNESENASDASGIGGLVGSYNRYYSKSNMADSSQEQILKNSHADMILTLEGGGAINTGAVIGQVNGTSSDNDSVTLTGITYGSGSYTANAVGTGSAYLTYATNAETDLKSVASPSLKVNSAELTLDGGISLTYDITYTLPTDTSVFSNAALTVSTPAGDGEYSGNGTTFSVSVPAAAIGEDFSIALHFTYGGKELTVHGVSQSVSDLILSTMGGNNATDADAVNAELGRLISAMQQYGDYAKDYFAGETVDANAVLSAVTDTQLQAYPAVINGSQDGLIYKGTSLILGGTTTVRHNFTLEDGKALSDFTFTKNGSPVTPLSRGNGWYFVEVGGILAQDLDTVHTVCLGGLSIQYCALSYADAMVKNRGIDPEVTEGLINAVKALYLYNRASEMYFDGSVTDTQNSGWLLSTLPVFEGTGTLSSALYDTGAAVTDTKEENINLMQLVAFGNETDAANGLEAYVQKLQRFGFTVEEDTALEANRYVTLFDGLQRVHIYSRASQKSVRIALDIGSVSAEEFSGNSDTLAQGSKTTTFYHYGLNRDPGGYNPSGKNDSVYNLSGYTNAGQLTVIKCADDSVIIVDGGSKKQMVGYAEDNEPMERFNAFLHEITGKGENEKITISCWYLTHADGDHTEGFYTFLSAYAAQYDLQRICTNIPAFSSRGMLNRIGLLVRANYPDCQEIKIHTGQSVTVSDVTLQALYTHEDNVHLTTGVTLLDNNNNNGALTMKISTENMSMLVTGDINTKAESVLCEAFTAATLKVDIVQTPHHGFNKMTKLYTLTQATHALFTQAQYGLQKPDPNSDMSSNKPTAVYSSFVANSPTGTKEYYEAYYCNSSSISASEKLILATADLSLIRDDPTKVPAYYQTYTWGFSYSESAGEVVQSETYIHVFANSK